MKDKVVILILALLFILHGYWIFSSRILPFVDVPIHLSAAVIKHNLNDPSLNLNEYYEVPDALQSNLFHLYFVSAFDDVEFGNKIFYLLYLFLLPAVVFIFIYKLKGNLWFSLFAFLAAYNYNTIWGFTNYTISIPFVLLFCFLLIFYYDYSLTWEIILSVLSIFIFFVHFQSSLFCVLIFVVYSIYSYIDHKIFNIKGFLIIVLPLTVVSIYAYQINTSRYDAPLFTYLWNYYTGDYIIKFPDRIGNLFIIDNFFIFKSWPGKVWAVIIFLSLTGNFIYSLFREKVYDLHSLTIRKLYLVLIVSFVCFLILPDDIPGQSMIYSRFPVYIALFALIAGSKIWPVIKSSRFTVTAIIVITAVHYLAIAHYFYDFQIKTGDFNAGVLPDKGTKEVTGALIYDSHYRSMPSFIHHHLYNIIWNKNVTTGLVDYRFFIVKRKTDMKKFPPYNAWVGLRNDYKGEYDSLKYLLVKGKLRNKMNDFNVIKKSGTWNLYENSRYFEMLTKSDTVTIK